MRKLFGILAALIIITGSASAQSRERTGQLIGIHQITAYAGDIHRDAKGRITNRVVYRSPKYHNLIVTTGKNLTMDRLFGLSSAVALTSVGVGNENTAAALTDTKLNPTKTGSTCGTTGTDVCAVLIQTADAGTSRTAQTVTISSTFTTGVANFLWTEGGLFTGNVNGTSVMFNRVVLGPFQKSVAVSIIYTIQISQS